MYNLNYNVTNARLNRPVGRPFVPTPRFDAFSSSLVVAIPGTIFKNGYVNVFHQVMEYDDISAYIVSGSVLNPSTGKYNQQGPNYTCTLTQSFDGPGGQPLTPSYYTGSTTVNNFASVGYNTSMYFSGSATILLSSDSGSMTTRGGTNIGTSSNWVMEAYVAYDLIPTSSNNSVSRTFMEKYRTIIGGTVDGGSYGANVGWSGDISTSPPPIYVNNTGRFIGAFGSGMVGGEQTIYGTSGATQQPNTFYHFAVSYSTGSVARSAGTIRYYLSGSLVGSGAVSAVNNINTSSIQTNLFGGVLSGQYGAFFQDFRFYNGSNKNYTGSAIPLPPSMVIGLNEPYPQYNP
jgi:hypothetical protein